MKIYLIIFFISLSIIPLFLSIEKSQREYNEMLKIQEGLASYYGRRFHLRKTANGEVFNMEAMTAAHKNLPFGTTIKVTNTKNGLEVLVRINDRLPQNSKRIIDLSRGAATELGMIQDGIVPVILEATDQETIYSLIEYFQENVPEGLRLRIYEKPIISSPDFSWIRRELDL
jgi:rare lipoprotein A